MTEKKLVIELGNKDLAVVSPCMVYENCNKTSKIEKRLRRLQRELSQKYQMKKGETDLSKPVISIN
ncbi:MAG: hypothetical protein Q6A85_07325 [Enterococcus mundtii]|nr:hypothetical protein [Enterococcus mundtii]